MNARQSAENDVLAILHRHSIGAFNGSQSACSHCRVWMAHDEYRQHLAELIGRRVRRAIPPAATDGGAA